MTVVLCIDDSGGMMFNHRRQSRDRYVYADIVKEKFSVLRMKEYSAPLFSDETVETAVSERFLDDAEKGDLCFVEDEDITPYLPSIRRVILYRWNRRYPYDMKFETDLDTEGFSLKETNEFSGYSHEKITKEVYER